MQKEITLDARDLPPPEPLFQALDRLNAMAPGEYLRLLIHREPMMLYPQLDEMKIPWKVLEHGHPDWVILIGPLPERR
ncbi:MAG: DUF2249 domain-containing protein [Gammaproteobacteria bacterium]|nr:DUF2249 domain-containing protein [Gammaproteobacteria bacterium]